MKFLVSVLFLAVLVFSTNLFAGFEGMNGGSSLKIFDRINCGTNVTCTRTSRGIFNIASATAVVGDGTGSMYGYLQEQGTATTSTLTAADCGKSYVTATTAEFDLPEASTVLGCRYTFTNGTTDVLTVDPYDNDFLYRVADASSDSITSDLIGNSVTLEAITALGWAAVHYTTSWTDAN